MSLDSSSRDTSRCHAMPRQPSGPGALTKRLAAAVVLAGAVLASASPAIAGVRHEGVWPEPETKVSLELDNVPRAEAIRKLADAAGWSIVSRGIPDGSVSLDVHDQPASKVLDSMLEDGSFVAARDGNLISLAAAPAGATPSPAVADASEPAAPSAMPAAAQTAAPGEDRTVTGGNLRIEPDEVVGDVTVLNGNLDLLGTATGDVTVVGGSARIHKGAHVQGDATAVGGILTVDDGAKVDGEVSVVGGSLDKEGTPRIRLHIDDAVAGLHQAPTGGTVSKLVDEAGHAVARGVMLFILGIVLLALGSRRMEILQGEVAARPMRSLALGVVGSVAAVGLFAALCVTIIGIPVAVAGLVAVLLVTGAGICAVLTTAGAALVGHRTHNPYLHLAVGSLLYLLLSAIPYAGGIVTAAVVFVGAGSLIATRMAGMLPKKNQNGVAQGPYRTAATI
jgi:hypothetical protein